MTEKDNASPSATIVAKKPGISLYPNPTADFFQISGINDTAWITISDLCCRVLIKKQIIADENISISTLRNGVYIAKIVSATGTVERKLVKE